MSHDEIRAALVTRPRDACALTLIGEVTGEPVIGQVAVAACIRNRVRVATMHGGRYWWGADYASVCLAKWQFSCWWETAPNTTRLYAIAGAVIANTLTTADATRLIHMDAIVDGIMSDVTPDPTRGSTHYVTNALLAMAPPAWAKGLRPCAIIGHHSFFKDVP